MLYYVRSYKHIEALWFANTANSLLWWTYVKAFWRALNSVFGDKIKFKTTLKGALPSVPALLVMDFRILLALFCHNLSLLPVSSTHIETVTAVTCATCNVSECSNVEVSGAS